MSKEMETIGDYCRNFRIHVLDMPLKEIEGSTNIKTLSGFEHGRSSNITHIMKYIRKCSGNEQRLLFLKGLISTIERIE
jgi:hypothetical protein